MKFLKFEDYMPPYQPRDTDVPDITKSRGSNSVDSDSVPITLTYADYRIFSRYWQGQSDPLYAVLSRRGNSVQKITMQASTEEIERLKQTADEIIHHSQDDGEIRTAKEFLDRKN